MPCEIIIPVFNQKEYTQECIEAIIRNTGYPYRIIVVDDCSDSPMREYLDGLDRRRVKIVRNRENLGWVRSVNRGLGEVGAEAKYICIMNNDTVVSRGWLKEMVAVAEQAADIGLVNPRWEKSPRVDREDYARSLRRFRGQFIETDWARGFCFLAKRAVIDKIGGLDEEYSPGYYDDCDFSLRAINAGFRCVRARAAYVHHHRNVSQKDALGRGRWNELQEKNKQRFYRRWGRPKRILFVFGRGGACAGNTHVCLHVARKQAGRPACRVAACGTGRAGIEQGLFRLARRQHRLYFWITSRDMPHIEHTNARISIYPRPVFAGVAAFRLADNLRRRREKRFDIVFVDNRLILRLFSFLGLGRKTRLCLFRADSFLSSPGKADGNE